MGSPAGAPAFTSASFGLAASSSPRNRCRPSPCTGLSPARSTTAAPPRPGPIDRRRTQPDRPRWTRGSGQTKDGSRVHCDSLVEGGARLCPNGLATSTPQTFPAASRSPASRLPEVPRPRKARTRRSQPTSTRFEPVRVLRGVMASVPRVLLSDLLTGPTTSGSSAAPRLRQDCSHPTQRLPGQAVLSSYRTAATAQRWWSFTSTRINSASRRTKAPLNAFEIAFEGRLSAARK